MVQTPLSLLYQLLHKAAPYTALHHIIQPHEKVSGAPSVVTTDGANHIIHFSQTVSTQFVAFLHYFGGRGVLFLLVLCLVIPVSHVIFILFPLPPPVPCGCPFVHYYSAASS